jgi:hypothetical protein
MLEDRGRESTGGVDSPAVPSFFPGMVWPVPVAFAGAIAAMRFEQGDVLYRDPAAYETLEGKIPKGLSAIQVLLPKRSARVSTSSEFEGDRRKANWQSEVTVELVDLARGQSQVRVLTQGKLAMAIFRGDDAWLDPTREEPSIPRSARELQQRLAEAVPSFDARQTARRGSRFLFVVDLASDASRSRRRVSRKRSARPVSLSGSNSLRSTRGSRTRRAITRLRSCAVWSCRIERPMRSCRSFAVVSMAVRPTSPTDRKDPAVTKRRPTDSRSGATDCFKRSRPNPSLLDENRCGLDEERFERRRRVPRSP